MGQIEPLVFDYASFAVRSTKHLPFMRVPKSLFQADFDRFSGCIYHLLEADDQLTAWNLLKRDWYDENGDSNGLEDNLEFINNCIFDVGSVITGFAIWKATFSV